MRQRSKTFLLSILLLACSAGPSPAILGGFPLSSFRQENTSDAKNVIDIFMRNLAADSDEKRHKGEIFEDDKELASGIKSKKVDFFLLNSDLFLRLSREEKITPVMVAVKNGSPLETMVLVAHRNVSLADLRGASLEVDANGRGRTPERWITDSLMRSGFGEAAREFFGSFEQAKSASHALLPVYFRRSDAAILSLADYEKICDLNPKIRRTLHVVSRSKPLITSIICRRNDRPDIESDLLDLGGALQHSDEGVRMLKLLDAEKLVKFKEEYLLHNRLIFNRTEDGARKELKKAKEGRKQ